MEDSNQTIVADPPWVWPALWLVAPAAGAAAGWLLKLAVVWALSLPAAPLPGWLRLAGGAPEPWVTLGAIVLGLAGGVLFVLHAYGESLTVTVSADRLRLTRDKSTVELDRGRIGAVFLDGKQLVLLGRTGEELAREPSDLDAAELAGAFTGHGYPWQVAGDPYRDEYRRWVPDLPDLPPGADALLRARDKALANDDQSDAAQLRTELRRLGVAVRDEEKRQYWRRHPVPDPPPPA